MRRLLNNRPIRVFRDEPVLSDSQEIGEGLGDLFFANVYGTVYVTRGVKLKGKAGAYSPLVKLRPL